MLKDNNKYSISGYEVLRIEKDCPEDLLYQIVEKISVRGKIVCNDSIKEHYKIK